MTEKSIDLKNEKRQISPIIFFFMVLLLPSPILFNLGLRVRWGSFLLVILYIVEIIVFCKKTGNVYFLLFVFFSTIGLGTITAFHYLNISYIIILSALIGYALFYTLLQDSDIEYFTYISSIFLFILEIGAVIGFVYAFIGGNPLFYITNPDERRNYFFLSTFSNAVLGKFIRPSGIYDEAGALSFYICAICALRIHYRKNPIFTFIMLLLGLITFSLTHFLCFCLFCIPLYKQFNKKQRKLSLFIILFCLIIIFLCFFDIFDKLLFSRLKFDSSTGTIKGNSRNGQIEGCLKSIKENGFLFGNYNLGSEQILRKYGVIGENPLSCLALNGLFNSFLYYVFLLVAFIAFCCSFKFEYLIMLALFFQRPYQSQLGYSFFFIHYLYLSFQEIKMFLSKNKRYFCLVNMRNTNNA